MTWRYLIPIKIYLRLIDIYMLTDCNLTYLKLSEEKIDNIDISKILKDIKALDYNPMLENISKLKSSLTNIFSKNGFILDRNLGTTKLKINGTKNNTGLAIQTGNAARFYADILKLQWLYEKDKIDNAIYVCLSKFSSKDSYSSNLINSERVIRELNFFDNIIKIPILLIEIDFIKT
jgi:hypothetical protein